MQLKRSLIFIFPALLLVIALLYFTKPFFLEIFFSPQEEPAWVPANLSWHEATTSIPWSERDAQAVILFQNQLFLMGGLEGNTVAEDEYVEYWEAPHKNDVWNSPDGKVWTLAQATSAWPPRRSLSVVEFNGKLWMIGGWSPIEGYHTDIWSSGNGLDWRKEIFPPWEPREGQIVEVFQGKLWMYGGVNFDKRKLYNDAWYSGDGVNWTQATGTVAWSPRYDHDIEEHGGKLYLFGGLLLGGQGLADAYVSEDGASWTLLGEGQPWGPLHGHKLLSYRNYLWIVGGWDTEHDRGSQKTWYSADGLTWQQTATENPWVGREDHEALVWNDSLWIFGGMGTGFHWKNDVWYATTTEQ